MSTAPETNAFTRLASTLTLIAAGLFFTGWIYRWSYFLFFQVEVTTLDLPVQSFFFVPLQVFLGDFPRIRFTLTVFLIAGLGIYLLLWLFNTLISRITQTLHRWDDRRTNQFAIYPTPKKQSRAPLKELLRGMIDFNKTKSASLNFFKGLLEEIIVILLVILMLYWIARTQGEADARRDAGTNSTLPAVTFITRDNRLPVGSNLEDEFVIPPLKGYKIIGDRGMFNDLSPRIENDLTNPNKQRVWRLLIERGGWIYLFSALPPNAPPDQRPLVLAIQKGEQGEQLLILSPEPSKPRNQN